MSMGQELLGLSRDIHNINTSKFIYLYDRQIMTLDVNTCHKNEYKSNNNQSQDNIH